MEKGSSRESEARVDIYAGREGTTLPEKKWFAEWFSRLPGAVSKRLVYTPRRYAGFHALDRLVRRRRDSVHLARVTRRDAVLHIPTHLLAGAVASFPLPVPLVITCYDVLPYIPEGERLVGRKMRASKVRAQIAALRRADQLIAPSDHAARTIVRTLGVPPVRMTVVPCGVDLDRYRPRSLDPAWMRAQGFSAGAYHLLYVGTEAPRKNLVALAEGLALLRGRGVPAVLHKVGIREACGEPFRRRCRELGVESAVLDHGEVSEALLPRVYNAAHTFVFPSRYEGFGLPVLEAMASGTPVVASNATSIPEVAEDAAWMVDPDDVEGLASAIATLWEDRVRREDLARRGLERARGFVWDRSAAGIAEVYGRVRETPGS